VGSVRRCPFRPAATIDGLAERLRLLKAWAGNPSYETATREVNEAWTAAGRPAAQPERPARRRPASGRRLHRRRGPAVPRGGRPGVSAGNLDTLGLVHLNLGEHAGALACYRRAIEISRVLGNRYFEETELAHLGDTPPGARRP
jgi:hypothetical protein